MKPEQLLALCVWTEARGEPDNGKAAVARVVLNRRRLRYSSDGSLVGTILAPDQFSAFWFGFQNGRYTRLAHTHTDAWGRANVLYTQAANDPAFARCAEIADKVMAGTFEGPGYSDLTDDTVCYYNPMIVKPRPAWADPEKHVTDICRHAFFRA